MSSTMTIIKPVHVGGGSFNVEQDCGLEDETWVCTNGFTGV
jgi:hypothetical protein